MRGYFLVIALSFAPQLSRASTFFCTGRAGPFQVDFADDSLIISGLNRKRCVLPQDKTFNSEERYAFQVHGTYDNGPEEIAEKDIPEIVSPEGYLAFGDQSGLAVDPGCLDFFEGRSLRNFYIQQQMTAENPDNFEHTLINVFRTPQGWPMLYLNVCVQKVSQAI